MIQRLVPKSPYVCKKKWMRLWIGTSTFDKVNISLAVHNNWLRKQYYTFFLLRQRSSLKYWCVSLSLDVTLGKIWCASTNLTMSLISIIVQCHIVKPLKTAENKFHVWQTRALYLDKGNRKILKIVQKQPYKICISDSYNTTWLRFGFAFSPAVWITKTTHIIDNVKQLVKVARHG